MLRCFGGVAELIYLNYQSVPTCQQNAVKACLKANRTYVPPAACRLSGARSFNCLPELGGHWVLARFQFKIDSCMAQMHVSTSMYLHRLTGLIQLHGGRFTGFCALCHGKWHISPTVSFAVIFNYC